MRHLPSVPVPSESNEASSSSATSWRECKNNGKDHFRAGRFEDALASYRSALNPDLECPRKEKQIVLSNVVACRLKIGGRAMTAAAIEDAKQCIALDEEWANGHIRLASAYIAMGGHSNDACNALRRALEVDRGNATARQMLVRELRRDDPPTTRSMPAPAQANREDHTPGTDGTVTPPPQNPNYVPPPQQNDAPANGAATNDAHAAGSPFEDEFHDDEDDESEGPLSWWEWIESEFLRIRDWYKYDLSDGAKAVLHTVLIVLVLYLAFGGRFGLAGDQNRTHPTGRRMTATRGNYEYGNAYDRFYQRQRGTSSSSSSSSYSSASYSSYSGQGHYGASTQEQDYRPPSSSRRSHTFHFPDLFDGSFLSLFVLLGVAFVCSKLGFNPFTALFVMYAVGGGRDGRRNPWFLYRLGMMEMLNQQGIGVMNFGRFFQFNNYGRRRRRHRAGWGRRY